MRALTLLALVSGCGPYAYDSGAGQRAAEVAVEPYVPCEGEVVTAAEGRYCYESRWDDVLQLYYGLAPGGDLRVDVDTRRVHPGDAVKLGDAARAWTSDCDLEGVLEFKSDEPRWALALFGSCVDQPERGSVLGRWSGRTR